jgi:hypothetical protein
MRRESITRYLLYVVAVVGPLALAVLLPHGIDRFVLPHIPDLKRIDAITTAIYLATAIIIALYTVDTWARRQQTVKLYKIELLPLVVAFASTGMPCA